VSDPQEAELVSLVRGILRSVPLCLMATTNLVRFYTSLRRKLAKMS